MILKKTWTAKISEMEFEWFDRISDKFNSHSFKREKKLIFTVNYDDNLITYI